MQITIRNFSTDYPISINGEVVQNKQNLFNNTKIEILDRMYLWEFDNKNSTKCEDSEGTDVSTPQKQIGIPKPSAFSSPAAKVITLLLYIVVVMFVILIAARCVKYFLCTYLPSKPASLQALPIKYCYAEFCSFSSYKSKRFAVQHMLDICLLTKIVLYCLPLVFKRGKKCAA